MKVNQKYTSYLNKTISISFVLLCFCTLHIGLAKENISKVASAFLNNDTHTDFQSENINVFEILAEQSEISIEKGSSGSINLSVNRATDFTGQVNLSIFPSPGLPAGVNAPFTPSAVPANASSSVLTLEISEQAISGTYNIVIAGTGSQDGTTRLRTVSISLTIEDVQPAGVIASFDFLQGASVLSGLSGIGNNISLDVQDLPEMINFSANTSGAVTAVEWKFKQQGSQNNIQAYLDNNAPYTLYPSGGWTVTTGVYELQAVQINNSETGAAKTIIITIESAPVPSFNITASPSSITLAQGESKSTEIKLSPVNSFVGQVDLVTDNLPEGVEGFFSITTLNSEGTSNLRFEADERAPVGSYSIRVQALGPDQLSASIIIDLNINRASSADFELSINRNSLNIIRGEEGRVNLTIKPLNGFDQTVNFEVISSNNLLDFQFNPAEVKDGNGSTEMIIRTTEEMDLGLIEVSIFATADTIERLVVLALTIDPIPIELKPKNQFSPNGDGIDDVWEIEEILELPDHTVLVFDRSGKEVFKAQPYNNDWDGKSMTGIDLLPTTYFFVVRDGGGAAVKSGTINLLR
jgi:gliding motility-associated-like protein